MPRRHHRSFKVLNFIRAWSDATNQVTIHLFHPVFPWKIMFRLLANPILQQHFALRRCETHRKHTTQSFRWSKKFKLTWVLIQWYTSSACSKSDGLLPEQISVHLFSHRIRVISVIISLTELKRKGKRCNPNERHFLWWTPMENRRNNVLGFSCSHKNTEKINRISLVHSPLVLQRAYRISILDIKSFVPRNCVASV